MTKNHVVTRRSVLIGGASVALVGCDTSTGVSPDSNEGPSSTQLSDFLPSWTDLGLYLTMGMVAASGGGALAGLLGLSKLAYALKKSATLFDQASMIHDIVGLVNQARLARFTVPTTDAPPKAFMIAASGDINDFESLPVFMNDVMLQFAVLSEQGGSFGDFDIYAAVKRADEAQPRALDDVWGSGDLPHAIVSPPPNGNYDGRLSVGTLAPGAYVSYSWRVPRGQQPTDEFIANTAFIGPVFLSVDDANYTADLAEALDSGRDIEARYQLPDASVI